MGHTKPPNTLADQRGPVRIHARQAGFFCVVRCQQISCTTAPLIPLPNKHTSIHTAKKQQNDFASI